MCLRPTARVSTRVVAGDGGSTLPAYIPELDGIRAIAVLMVIAMHLLTFDAESMATLSAVAPGVLVSLIGHGWLGVDLFFVLSGFLITGILLDTRHSQHFFRHFYGRRVLRIVPLYYLSIALMACFYRAHGSYFLLSSAFLANFAGLLGIAIPHGSGVFWSLAVEEHFYLIWPGVVRFANRRVLAWVCVAIVIFEPALRAAFATQGTDVYFLSWFRFDGLASGALLAIWFRSPLYSKRCASIAAAACIAAAFAITIAGLPFGIMAKTVAGKSLRYDQATLIYCAAMLVAITARSTRLSAPLRWGWLRLTGNLSYCLYLIHLALLDGYIAVFRRFVPTGLSAGQLFFRAVVVLSASYAVALLSRRFLELPFLSLKRYLVDKPQTRELAFATEA